MANTIRVRAVDGAVVFAIDPTTGRLASPLRAIGREGPSIASKAMPFEDVLGSPVVLRALEAGDLEEVSDEEAQPEASAQPEEASAPDTDTAKEIA